MICKKCGAQTELLPSGVCSVCAGKPPYLESWDALEQAAKACRKCSLSQTRTNTVFGTGNRSATLMFVGEAPGEKEDLSGVPFVGAAGQLFDRYLTFLDIPRDSVYIANILKCRPPHNRDPEPQEQDACMDYLRNQVRLVRPRILVCLGRIAAMRLISPDFRITRDHGKWFRRGGMEMCAVYHPSLLLRDPSRRADMMRDLMAVREKLKKAERTS